MAKWRRMWQLEASNPQRLSPAQLQARMAFTFKQLLMVCWLMPQVTGQLSDPLSIPLTMPLDGLVGSLL